VVIFEIDIDICRAGNFMLKQHGNRAEAESDPHALDLAAAGDPIGAAIRRRIGDAIHQLQPNVRAA
jgi:hypothetical protein